MSDVTPSSAPASSARLPAARLEQLKAMAPSMAKEDIQELLAAAQATQPWHKKAKVTHAAAAILGAAAGAGICYAVVSRMGASDESSEE